MRSNLGWVFAIALVACSGAGASVNDGTSPGAPAPSGSTTTEPPPNHPPPPSTGCPRAAPAADHARKVVVSHPFVSSGVKGKGFEVLDLSADGKLSRINVAFEMRTAFAEIAFTPDGKVGIVAQDDGTLGVFTLDDAGKATVIHEAFSGKFYADHVVISKDGSRAFVLDPQTANNGGGVHEVAIGCDGKLTYVGLAVTGGLAHAMTLMPNDPDRAILVAGKAFDSPAGTYVHRLDLAAAKPERKASGGAFGDNEALAAHVAITPDAKYAVISDNGYVKGNRIVAVSLDTMTPAPAIVTPNPAGVAMSPFGNAALLMSSDGEDALRVMSYDPTRTTKPFIIGAEVTYVGGKTQLPLLANVIDRGALKGRVLVAENVAIRQLVFSADGKVTDLGITSFGEGIPSIVGSLGVQP